MSDSAVFFAHVPRSGGTSVLHWVRRAVGPAAMYPGEGAVDQLSAKMFPSLLEELGQSELESFRVFAPHLPLASCELLGRAVTTATVLRDPWAQVRSSLSLQGLDTSQSDFSAMLAAVPTPWYSAHQLQWYLGASSTDVQQVFGALGRIEPLTMMDRLDEVLATQFDGRDLVSAACERLHTVSVLGFTDDLGAFLRRLAVSLDVAAPKDAPAANRGRADLETVPVPVGAREALAGEYEIYNYAKSLFAGAAES